MSSQSPPSPHPGPVSYRNWRAMLTGSESQGKAEIPLYSDFECSLPSFGNLGPYALQHAFPVELRDPALLLHYGMHLGDSEHRRPMDRSDFRAFTGEHLGNELAALISLANGRRLVAGQATRFPGTSGQVIVMGDRDRPTFFRVPPSRMGALSAGVILPRLLERTTLSVGLLPTYPDLSPEAATVLVRAARAYRDAIWIAETEPELAWLLLVTALEIAATHEQAQLPAMETLEKSKPELAQQLASIAPALAEYVAESLARELRATARFLAFMKRFLPPAPPQRPQAGQIDWSPSALNKTMAAVYAMRSVALHDGIPFPPAICSPPDYLGDQVPVERPLGLAVANLGGVWMPRDMPFHLHVFEYITRSALNAWWGTLVGAGIVTARDDGGVVPL